MISKTIQDQSLTLCETSDVQHYQRHLSNDSSTMIGRNLSFSNAELLFITDCSRKKARLRHVGASAEFLKIDLIFS